MEATHRQAIKQLQDRFWQVYATSPRKSNNTDNGLKYFFAPGRVNLMGDHIDYCGGKVLPATIACGTYLAARLRPEDDGMLYLHSLNENQPTGTIKLDLAQLVYDKNNGWSNYPQGVITEYQKLGVRVPALEMLYQGNMPIGSALSSSSSILLATAFAIQHLCSFHHSDDDIANRQLTALLCHSSEVGFNHLNCGTMDQAAVALGSKDKVMWLNCATFECEYITPKWGDYRLLIINSAKPRNLTETAYNQRYQEATRCLDLVKDKFGISNLCDLNPANYDEALALIKHQGGNEGALLHKRARHILSETTRVGEAAQFLATGNMAKFASILNASHESLRNDYEVTGYELDALVDYSMEHPAVIGARMTGGGFTGCTLSLVKEDAIDDYKAYIKHSYHSKTGLTPTFIAATPVDGVMHLEI